MKVRFLLHKGKGPDWRKGKWRWLKAQAISKGIIAWTWILALVSFRWNRLKDNYSHIEIWFPFIYKNKGYFTLQEIANDYGGELPVELLGLLIPDPIVTYCGQCFSSTTRGDAEGVRFAPASEVLHHPERWRYIEIEVDVEEVERTKDNFKALVGLGYDFVGLFGFFQPFNTQDSDKFYCSEICAAIAWELDLLPYYKRISPRRLVRKLADKYHEPKDLV